MGGASAARKVDAVGFAHASEAEFARILDFYRIRWEYEPRSFPLRWDGDRPLEMFTPDFYLPELDLYVELTTLRQALVTRKNRKLRRFKELYPEINIVLLYRRDYHELLAKYGYSAGDTTALPHMQQLYEEAEGILFSSDEVRERVRTLATQVAHDYRGCLPLLIGVLRGATFFLADLMRAMGIPVEIDFLSLSRFPGDGGAVQPVRFIKDLERPITGRHVLLVEGIVDTGFTLRYVLGVLRQREPASLEVCAFLDKRARRLVDVPLKYVGFEIGDEFVVGYGLDYRERYRNLPFIATLRPEVYRGDAQHEGKT